MAQEFWMVVAKNTNIGDVEVWHSDYEDCLEFYNGNDGMINGAHLEIVPDIEMELLMGAHEFVNSKKEKESFLTDEDMRAISSGEKDLSDFFR